MKNILLAGLMLALNLGTATAYGKETIAILAGGCFWCIEKDFEHVKGVMTVESGYIGGSNQNPTYKNHGQFGHREAVKIVYDDTQIDYASLLHIFWRTINPTDGGGQFCDRGHSYTTAIYALNAEQLEIAKKSKQNASKDLGAPIVTEIVLATKFTPSEDYHQDYYKKNPLRYKYYRYSCGRDKSVKKLWGKQAYQGVKTDG